jgi:hypothetical protein
MLMIGYMLKEILTVSVSKSPNVRLRSLQILVNDKPAMTVSFYSKPFRDEAHPRGNFYQ